MIETNTQRIIDNHKKIKSNIANAYTKAEEKGATLPTVQNSENLANTIANIPQEAPSWQPQPDWWDIDKVLEEDTEDYPAKMIVLLYATETNNNLFANVMTDKPSKIKTSDGAEYTNINTDISHTWDATKDKQCSLGYKTRYVIYYYDKSSLTFSANISNSSIMGTAIYLTVSGAELTNRNQNIFGTHTECIKFMDGVFKPTYLGFPSCVKLQKIIGMSLENMSALQAFSSNIGLININFFKEYGADWNTENVKDFSSAFNGSRIIYVPSLNFNSATNVSMMFNICSIVEIGSISNIKINGINLSSANLLNYDTLLRFLNALYDYSDDTESVHTIVFGATNLAKLTDEELAIRTKQRLDNQLGRREIMQVVKLENKNIKLVADEGKIIQSKATHYDEDLKQEVPDVSGKTIYLGKNDSEENYEEIEKTEGETEDV